MSKLNKVPGLDAWALLIKSERTRWHSNIDRFNAPLAEVDHDPKFSISSDDSFFCIGSCFARNVEEHLIYNGINVLSKRIICPKEEWPSRINGFVNKFTSQSMLNELEWTLSLPDINDHLFEETTSGWVDLQLCPGLQPATLERAIERRKYLLRDYFSRIRDSSVVVLTLGLNEAWFDARSERYLNTSPGYFSIRREPDRYFIEITDVEANLRALEDIREILVQIRPDIKIVVTVSPVPMSGTFSGKDVAVANTLSKAVLRVAAEAFACNHASVDYFPTFDMISISPRNQAYGADCLHVRDEIVGKMMRKFMGIYLGKEPVSTTFNELAYLAVNPDVEAELRLGHLVSGYEHWTLFGRNEGRPLAPPDGPTEFMKLVGAA